MALPISFLAWQSAIWVHKSPNFWLIGSLYFATLSVYNIHRLRGLNHMLKSDVAERHFWARRNRSFLKGLIFLSVVAGIIFFWFAQSFNLIPALVVPFFFVIGYTFPIFKVNQRWFRLRDIPFIKAIIIAFSVSWVTVLVGNNGMNFNSFGITQLSERFFFVLAITIPFDIRDFTFDSHSKLKTIPLVFGISKAKLISYLFLVLAFISVIYLNQTNLTVGKLWPAFIATYLIASIIIYKAQIKSSEFFYSFLVEGTMILQSLLVFFAHKWLR